jgi:dynein heavy chain
LEKVEIGGVKGKALSSRVVKIFEEFKDEFEKFSNKKYDPLDPQCQVNPTRFFSSLSCSLIAL